jgi:hypothetical protein
MEIIEKIKNLQDWEGNEDLDLVEDYVINRIKEFGDIYKQIVENEYYDDIRFGRLYRRQDEIIKILKDNYDDYLYLEDDGFRIRFINQDEMNKWCSSLEGDVYFVCMLGKRKLIIELIDKGEDETELKLYCSYLNLD